MSDPAFVILITKDIATPYKNYCILNIVPKQKDPSKRRLKMSSQQEKIKPKITVKLPYHASTQPKQPSQVSKSVHVIHRELRRILPEMNLEERQTVANQLIEKLEAKGVGKETLQSNLDLTTVHPKRMNPEEITQVAIYAYQFDPEVFESVLTQPNIVQFLSRPILSAIVGIMAAKWLN